MPTNPLGRWLVLLLLAAHVSPAPGQSAGAGYLDTAAEAARWIRAHGIRTEQGLVWPADPRDPRSVSTTLYAGTPGVVLFLLEMHHATGEPGYLRDARHGADHLLSVIEITPNAGLYTGLGGLGFTLGEVYRATKEPKYREGVSRVVARLERTATRAGSGVEWSAVTDVIGGTAGTGLFLLYAAETFSNPDALALARAAGRRLLDVGEAELGGTKWRASPDFPRLMPNFSHGTAGIAYFLASLYRATGDQVFLSGALSGARYLKQIADTRGDVCLVFHHEPQEEGRKLFYLGYCHGPAGTARLWYRLHQVTGDAEWLEWTEKSARGILASGIPETRTPGFWNNVSQCCGSAGIASFFLVLHQVTGKAEYLAFSRRVTEDLIARATRDEAGVRWVQAEHRVKPELLVAQTGWMQGAAGMAAWLAQLDGAESRRARFVRLPDDPF